MWSMSGDGVFYVRQCVGHFYGWSIWVLILGDMTMGVDGLLCVCGEVV